MACVFEALACGLDVIDADTNMTEAFSRVGIAVVDAERGVVLGAVVMCQFEDAFAIRPVVLGGGGVGAVVSEEVEIEFGVGEGEMADLGETEVGVEFDLIVDEKMKGGSGGKEGDVLVFFGSFTLSMESWEHVSVGTFFV